MMTATMVTKFGEELQGQDVTAVMQHAVVESVFLEEAGRWIH